MTSTARTVYLDGAEHDTVWFDASMTDDEARRSLIDHDGYPAGIIVERQRVPLDRFAQDHGIGMQVDRVKRRPDRDHRQTEDERRWDAEASHYRVRLLRPGAKPFGLYYSMGSAHRVPPTLPDVLDNLASDCASIEDEDSFEAWADSLGYGPDSRRAERIYRVIEKQAEALRAFLGDGAYEALLYGTERL